MKIAALAIDIAYIRNKQENLFIVRWYQILFVEWWVKEDSKSFYYGLTEERALMANGAE